MEPLFVDADIRRAETLPTFFYRRPAYYELSREAIFARTWQYAADATAVAEPGTAYPFTYLPGYLEEPLVLTHDRTGQRHCLSNVCTHRGKILVEKPGPYRQLSCRYHGRCFGLDGQFRSMPAFKETQDFPRPEDHLTSVSLTEWLGLCFVSLDPVAPMSEMVAPIMERVGHLPLDTLTYVPEQSQDFRVKSHWALYCDNYLEGFHIPFVHPALNQAIDFNAYEYHQFAYCNLQVGIAGEGEPAFSLPSGHPDHGRSIYGYYFWLFPNLMFNFYPWGLSLNLVLPQGPDTCLVRFRSYYFADTIFDRSANALEETEYEDEAVVESVQLGMQSRYYRTGRFSPKMEPNVHHFHHLLAQFINTSLTGDALPTR